MWQELSLTADRPPERDLKITDVKTMEIRGNPRGDGHYVWGIVKIETNSDHHGIGETFRGIESLDPVERMADTIIGENPLDPERIAEKLGRAHYVASGGIGRAAIAAIETACWDLKGKVHDVPVYELLGGKYRNEITLYSDTEALVGDSVGIDFSEEYDPAAYAEAAGVAVDRGFQVIKFDLDVPTPGRPDEDRASRRLDNEGIEHKVSLVEAVRDEVGDDYDLGMDLHWSYTVETAVRLGSKLERFDLAFLEDPIHPKKIDAQKRAKRRIDLPILTGENLTSVSEFQEALENDLLDIAAPDVAMCGGLAELQKIAAVCDAYGVPLAPHNLGSPVSTVAGAHLAASVQNFFSLEFRGGDTPWWEDLVTRTNASGPIVEDGKIALPEGPGLGIEITGDSREHVTEESDFVFD
jgi:L-alanine-DL-glutamate epimerase-like enolase superfamily enzyme